MYTNGKGTCTCTCTACTHYKTPPSLPLSLSSPPPSFPPSLSFSFLRFHVGSVVTVGG